MEFIDISELIVNDDDISNEEEVYEEVVEPVRHRGKDINWMLQDHWKNNDDFLESDFKKELNEEMKKRKDIEQKMLGLNIGSVNFMIRGDFILALDR